MSAPFDRSTQLISPVARLASGAVGRAVFRLDWDEHQRRQLFELAAVTDLHVLDRLLALPLHELVTWAGLTPAESRVMQTLPDGVVEFSQDGVRRVLSPAAEVDLAIVQESGWRAGLRQAGAFAPFCRRVLLMPAAPRQLRNHLWEADYYGIGVWIGTLDDHEEALAPASWQRQFVTPAGWGFRERAYDAWLATNPCEGNP